MLRRLLVTVLVALPLLVAAPVAADAGDPSQRGPVHPIVFPVIGEVSYSDTYGAPRGTDRSHAGQDLMGEKMQELVATVDGTISWITIPEASYGYMLTIKGDDGWKYHYVHLNNDTPGTDDGRADLSDVFGPGIAKGARVRAGQLVGYLGDSGNAEHTAPHLHFEMVDPSGQTVNPIASLDAAVRLDAPVGSETAAGVFPRLAGEDRVGTALAVSKAGWADGAAPAVVVASGTAYAEALPASVLAAKLSGPLLLVNGSTLPQAVAAELDRLGATRATVVGSVPAAVEDALRARSLTVARLGMAGDAVRTAAAIAREVGGGAGRILLVNGASFADGISGAALGAGRNWPVLLTGRDYVPQVSVDVWRALGQPSVVVLGGAHVVGDNVRAFFDAERVAGADRYATSVAAAARVLASGGSLDELLAATGTAFPDALAAAPLAARVRGVTVLVDGSGRGGDAASRSWLSEHKASVGQVRLLGGTAAINATAERAIEQALSR